MCYVVLRSTCTILPIRYVNASGMPQNLQWVIIKRACIRILRISSHEFHSCFRGVCILLTITNRAGIDCNVRTYNTYGICSAGSRREHPQPPFPRPQPIQLDSKTSIAGRDDYCQEAVTRPDTWRHTTCHRSRPSRARDKLLVASSRSLFTFDTAKGRSTLWYLAAPLQHHKAGIQTLEISPLYFTRHHE
jgi:hypothetical protein